MPDLRIATLQADLVWENKQANLARLDAMLKGLDSPQVALLPEMFNTGFSMRPEVLAETMEGPTVQWMRERAAQLRCILAGSLIIEADTGYVNRLVWMLPNGQYGYYDKRHLFAYGGEDKHFAAGSRRLIAQVNGWKLLLLTCYDLRFPVWSRQQLATDGAGNLQPEYDAAIYLANWPERRSHAWRSLLVARAIENQCYVIGVNRVGTDGHGIAHSGDTMVVDPLGETLYHAHTHPATETHTLSRSRLDEVRDRLPFWKDGDAFRIL